MLKINELSRLYLGVKGENNSRTIEIDMSAWASIYPNATAVILHKRSGDQAKELTGATYDSETKVLQWKTSSTDTFYDGFGVAEVRMVENNVVKKTKDAITTVTASSITTASGDVLESNYQAFLNAVTAQATASGTAKTGAETAQGYAEAAQAAAEAAILLGPYVDETTGNWFVWDWDDEEYKDTGVHAQGDKGDKGDPGSTSIDDTTTASNKLWSSSKTNTEISAKYTKPGTGIPATDLASAVQTSLGKADSAYQKPGTGIPAADMASGVIPVLTDLIDDTAGAGDTDKVFSAGKLTSDFSDVLNALKATQADAETCKDALTVETGTNYLPQFTSSQWFLGYYLEDGEVHQRTSGGKIGYIDKYVEVKPEQDYMFVFVPAFGSAVSPWYGLAKYGEVYDQDKNFIANISGDSTGAFSTPTGAKYVRFNVTGEDWNSAGGYVLSSGMLVKGSARPESYVKYDIQKNIVQAGAEVKNLQSEVSVISDTLDERTLYHSPNLYDPSLQTPSTISPHYYVNGVPYSSTHFDGSWNCTAPITIEPSTQYSLGLVPAVGAIVKPWNTAAYGAFFYKEDGTYISGTTDITFTTPSNAKTMRFNYYIAGGTVSLDVLNARCVLVKGASLPSGYQPYGAITIKEKVDSIGKNVNYVVSESGTSVTLISKYNTQNDLAVTIKKKGGNNLFDFYQLGIIQNATDEISKSADGQTSLMTTTTDWFAPFIFKAKNNIDGDLPSSADFTGGNHQYNNQGSGSTATARTSALVLKADNRVVTDGSGSCARFEMNWTNLVQATNTKKADGSGREVLQENHRMVFDGNRFEFFVDLIPLEDITMQTWYGAQWSTNTTIYPKVRYIGGTDREEHTVADARSSCGNNTCCHAVGYGDLHEIRLDIDEGYDLGDHGFIGSSATDAIFTATYGKGYCKIISSKDMDEDKMYSLHGWYEFRSRT